jgi:TonB family protein
MSLEPESVSRQSLVSLQGCLVGGDPEQRRRERGIRRRALSLSLLLQSAVLLTVVLAPLFANLPHLSMTILTPIPPYRHPAGPTGPKPLPDGGVKRLCVACVLSRPAPLTSTVRSEPNQTEGLPLGNEAMPTILCPPCIDIARNAGPQPPGVVDVTETPRVVHRTHIDPAMLVHRVEPVYPTLAKQLGRAGKVELRAVIATDGTIQSLQVVSGDPLFYQSALDAVRQWRYRPTVLNGEPVGIDTFITVIYNMQR